MSEPAKDEAELIAQITDTLSSNTLGFTHRGQAVRALAAIRAAGWAVVPVEPTMDMICAAVTHKSSNDHSVYFGVYAAMLAAAPGVKP